MFLILLLCLKASLQVSAVNLGYTCGEGSTSDSDKIFLVVDETSSWNYKLNHKFKSACGDFYEINECTRKDAVNYENVIYFGAPDYYEGKLPGYQHAGDLFERCYMINDTILNCDKPKKVKLISPSIQKHFGDYNIYDLIQNMKTTFPTDSSSERSCAPIFRNTQDLKTVLLCLETNTNVRVNIDPLKLVVKDLDDCKEMLEKYDHSLLALLAPKAFHYSSEHLVPTVFYDNPFMFPEDEAAFPNSVNLLPWRMLKYGFLGFLKSVGWERVVIVSDLSEYSYEFENELTALFNKERIIYTVIRSENAVFEIGKIKQKLAKVIPRIVIGNLEVENALQLIKSSYRTINWIVRDMAESIHYKLPSNSPNVFSIYLKAVSKPEHCNVDANILAGLSSIARAYKEKSKDHTVGRRMFNRQFSNEIKKIILQEHEAMAFVHKLSEKKVEHISTMKVNDHGAKVISFKNPFKSGRPADGPSVCMAMSYKYSEPCEDNLVMLLMFVLMLFFITSLLITCYFHRTSPFNDIRYQNF